MKCPECGAQNLDGAERCSGCQAPLGGFDRNLDVEGRTPDASRYAVWAVAGVITLALGAVLLTTSGGSSGGGAAGSMEETATAPAIASFSEDPELIREAVTQVSTETAGFYRDQNYAGVYSMLSAVDRDKVPEDEWVSRGVRLESILGTMTAFSIGDMWYLDPDRTVVFAEVEVGFSQLDEPLTTNWYFVVEGSQLVRTMMWGREATVSPEPVRAP